jgi:hypothetical protein
VLALLMGWVLLLDSSPQPFPQPNTDPVLGERIAEGLVLDGRLWLRGTLAKNAFGDRSGGLVQAEPPRILYIYREFWKPGTQADLVCLLLGFVSFINAHNAFKRVQGQSYHATTFQVTLPYYQKSTGMHGPDVHLQQTAV